MFFPGGEKAIGFPSYFLLTSNKLSFLLGDLQHPRWKSIFMAGAFLRGGHVSLERLPLLGHRAPGESAHGPAARRQRGEVPANAALDHAEPARWAGSRRGRELAPYSLAQSRPFDLLVFQFWVPIFSKGPKRLTLYFLVFWAGELRR